jgi:hypothetical protein
MARGAPGAPALDMSKYFDTNYHYLVPELTADLNPTPNFQPFLDKVPAQHFVALCTASGVLHTGCMPLHHFPCTTCTLLCVMLCSGSAPLLLLKHKCCFCRCVMWTATLFGLCMDEACSLV